MSIRFLFVISLIALLGACSFGKSKKDPVLVEDRGKDSSTHDSGVQTFGTGEDTESNYSELDDPQNPLSVRTIYFEFDSSDIQAQYREVIEAHVANLIRYPDKSITLEGHADERGSREYNLALGERRAYSIREQMLLLGVLSHQIKLTSYGEERPQTEGHDEVSWQQNRRVEIIY